MTFFEVATVLTDYGIETNNSISILFCACNVATVLTVYGIETEQNQGGDSSLS